MKTLYLDHHVLINEENWALVRDIVDQRKAVIAISNWNLVEIQQATDQTQKQRRVAFVESLSPVYVHDMMTLQRYELRSFAWLYYFQAGLYPYSAFAPTFADYLRANFGFRVRDDYSLSDYFRNARQEHLAPIAAQQDEMAAALTTLQTVSKKQFAQIEAETFIRYLGARLPTVSPDGKEMDQDTRLSMLKLCYEQREKLNRSSPAIFAEEELGVKRRQDPSRRPKPTDAADLMHCAVGLSYCDVLVTNDGFAFHCCEHAKAAMSAQKIRSADLFRSLPEFVATL
jgi:hypothetical protein